MSRFVVIAICSVVLFFPAFWLLEAVVGPNWGAGIAAAGMYIVFPVIALKVWPGKPVPAATELVQVDDAGVLRVAGSIREQMEWDEVEEIRIITTDSGPYFEDVFFALVSGDDRGCLIPHDAAVRTKLLEVLQSRFPGLDNEAVIKAMGCTGNNNFVIWKRAHGATA